jgi:hypothetical protein
MSAEDCINKGLEASKGKLSKEDVTRKLRQMREASSTYTNPSEFVAKVTEEAKAAKHEAYIKRRNDLINLEKRMVNIQKIENAMADSDTPGKAMTDALSDMIAGTSKRSKAIGESVNAEFQTRLNKMDPVLLDEFMSKVHSKDLSLEVANLEKFTIDPETGIKKLRSAGEIPNITGNVKARKIAEVMVDMRYKNVDRLNYHGADISALEGYGMKNQWDPMLIAESGNKEFIADMKNWIDYEKSYQGNIPGDSKPFFDDMYDTLSSGEHNFKPGVDDDTDPLTYFKGGGNMAKKMSHERKIVLKPEFQNEASIKYGAGGIENAWAAEMSRFARDVALMENFGTNPEAHIFGDHGLVKRLKENNKDLGAGGAFEINDPALTQLYDEVTGKAAMPVNTPFGRALYYWSNAAASYNVATRLGMVALNSISDLSTKNFVQAELGVKFSENMQTTFLDSFGHYGPEERAEIAKSLAIGLDNLAGTMHQSYQGASDGFGRPSVHGKKGEFKTLFKDVNATYKKKGLGAATGELMLGLPDLAFRLNFLDAMTKNNKAGTSVVISNLLGRYAGKPLADVGENTRALIVKAGLADDWALISSKVETTPDGEKFITPGATRDITIEELYQYRPDIKEKGEKFAKEYLRSLPEKVLQMISERRDIATMTPDVQTDAMVRAGTKRGTILGEVAYHVAQFKKYPIAIMRQMYGKEIFAKGGNYAMSRAPALFGMMTMAGYVSLSLTAIAMGNTPPDLTKPETVFAAIVKGGGAGILGDIMFKDPDFAGSAVGDLLGPTFGTVDRAIEIGLRTPKRLLDGDFGKIGKDVVKFTKSNLPFNNLFYTKAAMEFMLFNDLTEAMSPGYKASVEKQLRDKHQSRIFQDAPRSIGEVITR